MAEVNIDVAKQSTSEEILEKITQGGIAQCVKRIQHGFVSANTQVTAKQDESLGSWFSYNYYIDITISAVSNIDKCQVRVDNYMFGSVDSDDVFGNYIGQLINTNKLRVFCCSDSISKSDLPTVGKSFTWEVTEFY